MKFMLVFVAFFAMASATAINFEKPEESQERTWVSSDSGNFLTLNSTLLVGAVAVLAVLVVAALVASGGLSPARIQQKYGQKYEDTFSAYSDYVNNRYRRFASNGNITLD